MQGASVVRCEHFMVDHLSQGTMSPVNTLMGDHPDWCHCYISVTHDHAMPCHVPLPLVERLVVTAYKKFLEWSPTHKKVEVCTVLPMLQVHRKKCVDCQNMPNDHPSTCLGCGIDVGYEGCIAFKVNHSKVHCTECVACRSVYSLGVHLGGGCSSSYHYDTAQ